MPRKYEPSEEERERILKLYKEAGQYQKVSRQVGLNVTIVKRIIQENGNDPILVEYKGEAPIEQNNFWLQNKNNEKENYERYYELLKQLSNEVRANNGII